MLRKNQKTRVKKIGVWAGSSACPKDAFSLGLKHLRSLDVEVVIPKEVLKNSCRAESKARPFLAGSDKDKVKSFIALWNRKDLQNILAVRGGYGTLRLLSHLDQVQLQKNTRKKLWGFSDLTILQNYLYKRTGSAWVHSPMLSSRSFFEADSVEAQYWQRALSPEPSQAEHKLKILNKPKATKTRFTSAPMIGGNLACFVALFGTPWEPVMNKSFYLFLEDVSEKAYRVDRLLQQLSAGKLMKNCKGVILGHFTDCQNAEELIRLWAKENNILTLSGLKAGHDRPNLPLLMGVPVHLKAKNRGEIILTVPNPRFE